MPKSASYVVLVAPPDAQPERLITDAEKLGQMMFDALRVGQRIYSTFQLQGRTRNEKRDSTTWLVDVGHAAPLSISTFPYTPLPDVAKQ